MHLNKKRKLPNNQATNAKYETLMKILLDDQQKSFFKSDPRNTNYQISSQSLSKIYPWLSRDSYFFATEVQTLTTRLHLIEQDFI